MRAEIEENNRLTKFIFHQDTILAELDAEDNTKARLITGHGIVAANISGVDNNYYYHQDEQGSTAIITDENADIKNSYHYDAFGKILESQETLPNRITYTGQQYDPLTQQYYLRARYYNPIIGRFTQEDTYRGDGLNLYAYCSNNPISYYEPSGYSQEASPPCKAPAVTDADGGNTKKATEAGKLKSVGNGKWESPEGLIYEQGSIHGNRVKHVLDHTVPNPNKPSHTIFKVDKNKVIGLVDEAWKSRDTATVNRGNDLYDISMGKIVGTKGEKKIRIVTKRGTNKILSAYPR
ncbi:MAG: RHS repeat-associated core domain-containing protein [Cellulosilyticaceae bacterium]